MDALAQDLKDSEYLNIQTQFIAISILSHPDGHHDFIRTVLIFHQDRFGSLMTELP